MLAVLFEVTPKAGADEAYLNTALQLRPLLDQIEGFISIERFQSLSDPTKMLSLSFWESEESLTEWRNEAAHRQAQAMGQHLLFSDYRIRVAYIIRDYDLTNREEAPADSHQRSFKQL